MSNFENKEFTFWNLISEYKIEIPSIQRDYVQNRLYSDLINEDCDIVGDIFSSLSNAQKINLHFVYGKVINGDLIPIDGQQRLTTLFLIHWFLSLDNLQDNQRNILAKFTYETRPSTADFCFKLVKESVIFSNDVKISQQIKNSKWFFLSWQNDPSIQGMLNMLDIIQQKFVHPNEELFNLLCDKTCPVVFHFLPLEKFKLDDELYVKMNSRGKPLTAFENFKSNFSVLFAINDKSKLDNEWLDIFWKFEKNNETIDLQEVDRKYLTFIKNISLCFLCEYKDISTEEKDTFSINKSYKNIYSSDRLYLAQIIKTFNALLNFKDEEKYFETFLKQNPDYWEYLRFYAVVQFFIKFGNVNDTNLVLYKKWIRVSRNLINNTLVQSTEEFYKAIRSLKELVTHSENIYAYLSNPNTRITGFLQSQCSEEYLKANLIINDNSNQWFNAIEKIELHPYFNGQIGFILDFSKNNNDYIFEKFKNYSSKLNTLFSSEFQENYNCLFQRALLSFGNYLVPISGHLTFCKFDNNLRAKMDNWRKVFNDSNKNIYIQQLLDAIKIPSIKSDLELIVHTFEHNNDSWQSLFIKNEGIIEYCENSQIDISNNQIDLARSKATFWRKKAELRSYVFFKTMLESKVHSFIPFERAWYYDSSDNIPCAVLDHWQYDTSFTFAIDFYFSNDEFSLKFYDESSKVLPLNIVNLLTQINFISNIEQDENGLGTIKSCTSTFSGVLDFNQIVQKIQLLITSIQNSL